MAGFAWGRFCPEGTCLGAQDALLGALLGFGVGVVAALLAEHWGGFRLHAAKLKVPGIGELEFEVSDAQRQAGWRIFVEIATRIATQPLPAQHGVISEAIESLHNLFDVVRTELKTMPPSPATDKHTVEFLATRILNTVVRPFLAKWHPLLKSFMDDKSHEESKWPDADKCREELEKTRQELVVYALQLGNLVGVSNPARMLESQPA
jgi:hypothetical protein